MYIYGFEIARQKINEKEKISMNEKKMKTLKRILAFLLTAIMVFQQTGAGALTGYKTQTVAAYESAPDEQPPQVATPSEPGEPALQSDDGPGNSEAGIVTSICQTKEYGDNKVLCQVKVKLENAEGEYKLSNVIGNAAMFPDTVSVEKSDGTPVSVESNGTDTGAEITLAGGQNYVVTYYAQVDKSGKNVNDEVEVSNQVTLSDNKGIQIAEKTDTVKAKIESENPVVTKTAQWYGSNPSYDTIEYTITLNPEAGDIVQDRDSLCLIDEMTVTGGTARLVPDTINISGSDRHEYSVQDNRLFFMFDDEKPVTITYSVKIDGTGDAAGDIKVHNTAQIKQTLDNDGEKPIQAECDMQTNIKDIKGYSSYDSLVLQKVASSDLSRVLPGAQFELHLVSEEDGNDLGRVGDVGTSDSNGEVSFKNLIKNRLYYYVETGVPESTEVKDSKGNTLYTANYVKDDTKHYFMIVNSGDGRAESVEKRKQLQEKFDIDIALLRGGNSDRVIVTNDEVKKEKESFHVRKIGAKATDYLPGASFSLYAWNDGEWSSSNPIATGTSGRYGIAYFNGIEPGDYVLAEDSAPEGYKKDATSHHIVLDKDGLVTDLGPVGQEGTEDFNEWSILYPRWTGEDKAYPTSEIQIKNEPESQPQDITIKKCNEYDEGLAGATLALYRVTNGEAAEWPVDTCTSDEDGNVTFTNIVPGQYMIKETKAPEGYRLSKEEVYITIKDDGTLETNDGEASVTIYNYPQLEPTNLEFYKLNENGNKLSGATFGIYWDNALKEPVMINTDNYTILARGENDENNESVIAYTAESDEGDNGCNVTFMNLPQGETYYIKELSAPDYYKTNDKIYMVTLDNNEATWENDDNVDGWYDDGVIRNEKAKACFSFKKVDDSEEHNALPGATFGLYTDGTATSPVYVTEYDDSNYEYSETETKVTAVSDASGNVSFEDVDVFYYADNYGTNEFYVKEISAPSGYQLSNEVYQVSLNWNSDEKKYVFSWDEYISDEWGYFQEEDGVNTLYVVNKEQKNGNLKVIKQSEGATTPDSTSFIVKNEEGNKVAEFTYADFNKDGEYTVTGLPVGTYTVEESGAEVIGYTLEVSGEQTAEVTKDETAEVVITNTYTLETTEISVSKEWSDNNNQDGIRPSSITVNLLADGNKTASQEVTAGENGDWTYSFTGLPKYAEGKEIVYTVTEDTVTGYTPEITGNAEDGFVITNSHTPAVAEISVSKVWNDNDNQDGVRPSSITVNLLADGEKTVSQEVTADENGNWTCNFTGLPKYAEGKEIVYTVTEDTVTGYTPEITGNAEDGYVITNSHTPAVAEISVSKVWSDNDNQDGVRPSSITVNLLADGEKKDSKEVTADTEGNWTCSFTNLPKYAEGEEIIYTVTEEAVSGYEAEVTGSAEEGYVITNSHTPAIRGTIRFTKAGLYRETCAGDNQAVKMLQGVEFTLYAEEDTKFENPITTALSNQEGVVEFENVVLGTYVIKETKAADGYIPTEDVFKVTLDESTIDTGVELKVVKGNELIPVKDNQIINDVARADINLIKVDEKYTDKKMLNSKYGLYADEDGKEIKLAETVTDDNGMITFKGVLLDKEYTIKELEAPDGSYVSESPVSIRFGFDDDNKIVIKSFDGGVSDSSGGKTAYIDDDGNIVWLEPAVIYNFIKVDEDNNPLSGAKLRILDADGNSVEEWTTDGKVHEIYGKLITGEKYTLQELEAPEGYDVAADIEFAVPDNKMAAGANEPVVIIMVDKKAEDTTADTTEVTTEDTTADTTEITTEDTTADTTEITTEDTTADTTEVTTEGTTADTTETTTTEITTEDKTKTSNKTKTGDDAPILPAVVILLMSLAASGILVVRKRKNEK